MGKNYWMFVGPPERFEVIKDLGFTVYGVGPRYRRRAERMQPDDRVLFYVTKIRKWAATATITSRYFEDHQPIWQSSRRDDAHPYHVKLAPDVVLDERDYIDALILAPRLEYVKRWAPEYWPLAFFDNLHLLPQRDFRLIEGEMKRAVSKINKGGGGGRPRRRRANGSQRPAELVVEDRDLEAPGEFVAETQVPVAPDVLTGATQVLEEPGVPMVETLVAEQPGEFVAETQAPEEPGVPMVETLVAEQPGEFVAETQAPEEPGEFVAETQAPEEPGEFVAETQAPEEPGESVAAIPAPEEPAAPFTETQVPEGRREFVAETQVPEESTQCATEAEADGDTKRLPSA